MFGIHNALRARVSSRVDADFVGSVSAVVIYSMRPWESVCVPIFARCAGHVMPQSLGSNHISQSGIVARQ